MLSPYSSCALFLQTLDNAIGYQIADRGCEAQAKNGFPGLMDQEPASYNRKENGSCSNSPARRQSLTLLVLVGRDGTHFFRCGQIDLRGLLVLFLTLPPFLVTVLQPELEGRFEHGSKHTAASAYHRAVKHHQQIVIH